MFWILQDAAAIDRKDADERQLVKREIEIPSAADDTEIEREARGTKGKGNKVGSNWLPYMGDEGVTSWN